MAKACVPCHMKAFQKYLKNDQSMCTLSHESLSKIFYSIVTIKNLIKQRLIIKQNVLGDSHLLRCSYKNYFKALFITCSELKI